MVPLGQQSGSGVIGLPGGTARELHLGQSNRAIPRIWAIPGVGSTQGLGAVPDVKGLNLILILNLTLILNLISDSHSQKPRERASPNCSESCKGSSQSPGERYLSMRIRVWSEQFRRQFRGEVVRVMELRCLSYLNLILLDILFGAKNCSSIEVKLSMVFL